MVWLNKLIEVLPSLRLPVQLSGLVVTVAAAIIVQVAAPGNIPAILAAGTIGVSLVIFGQVFHFIKAFPLKQRVWFFLGLFAIFDITVVLLIVLTTSLIGTKEASADTTLFAEEGIPASWKDNQERTLTYVGERDKKSLIVTYKLAYLSDQEHGGPIYPVDPTFFLFPVPTFSIKVNNPTSSPLFVTEIILNFQKRSKRSIPWLIPNEPIVTKRNGEWAGNYGFQNVGWGTLSDVSMAYDITNYPPEYSTTHVCCVPPNTFKSIPGLRWDEPFPFKGKLERWDVQYAPRGGEFLMPLDARALAKQSSAGIATIFGLLNYNLDGVPKSVKFVGRIFYENPGGPGHVNPTFPYNAEIDPEDPSPTKSIPASQSVGAGSQDHFLLSIFTRKPADLKFNVRLRLSSGDLLPAGDVQLTTFYPSEYGPGQEPKFVP